MRCLPTSRSAGPDDPNKVVVGTADLAVRQGFLRKVYSILTLQFLFTVGLCAVAALVDPVQDFLVTNSWIVWVFLALSLGTMIALSCIKTMPVQGILFVLFTAFYGSLIACVVARYFASGLGKIVFQAAGYTAVIFIFLTLVVFCTKKDFSFLSKFLFVGLIAVIAASLVNFVFGVTTGSYSRVASFGISCVAAIVFSGYILYDTSNILHRYGPDEWAQAAIALYLYVIVPSPLLILSNSAVAF